MWLQWKFNCQNKNIISNSSPCQNHQPLLCDDVGFLRSCLDKYCPSSVPHSTPHSTEILAEDLYPLTLSPEFVLPSFMLTCVLAIYGCIQMIEQFPESLIIVSQANILFQEPDVKKDKFQFIYIQHRNPLSSRNQALQFSYKRNTWQKGHHWKKGWPFNKELK